MEVFPAFLRKFFAVITQGSTYKKLAYLLLAFPLGLFYFIFLVTGLSLGLPLIILWIGVVILVGVFAAWYAMAAFERSLAINLLDVDIPPMMRRDLRGQSLWKKFTAALRSSVTWKGLVYLFARFPLGILSFVVVVTCLAVSVTLIAAPTYYTTFHPQIDLRMEGVNMFNPVWIIDTLPEALLATVAGVILLFASLHLFNGLAWLSGRFARVMLGDFSTAPAAPAAVIAADAAVTKPEAS